MNGAPQERVNILLVDDRPSNLLSLKGTLDRPEYNLVLASSGPEALKLVLRHDFALILLDVAMPGMDGFEVASLLKQREAFKSVPIIFVTASVQHIEWIFKGYSVGAVDFLNKPLDPHAVRAKVAVFVELFRQRQQLRRQAELLRESERRERELEIRQLRLENERRYKNLAEAIPHIVWTAGPDGEVEYFNAKWFEATGRSEKQSLGRGWRDAVHPEDLPRLDAAWARARESGEAFDLECRLPCPDGDFRWYLCRALPEDRSQVETTRWLGTFTDIDEQRRAREEAQKAIRLRDEFLSVASHELRTPLTTLHLQLQTLSRRIGGLGAGDSLSGRVDSAVKQTRRLAGLIDTLLDVSRIATGRFELNRESFDLASLVKEVTDRFCDEANRGGCELEVVVEENAIGSWDRLRIEQVITNLLSNALKYAPGKPVRIVVGARDGEAFLSVTDHGIGIAREHLERIFGRFERAVPSRHYGGLGLGLYIVREIVEAHQGHIEVDSTPEEGSTFTVHLPFGRTAVGEATEEGPSVALPM